MADLPARIKQMKKLHGDAIGASDSPFDTNSLQRSLNNPNQENWKNFEKGSEAGRLMAKLYGGAYKPQISYPTLKTRKSVDNGTWRPSNKGNAVVSKFDKKKASKVRSLQRPATLPRSNSSLVPRCRRSLLPSSAKLPAILLPPSTSFQGRGTKKFVNL